MTERSYAPYSGVLVGASGLAEDGRVVRGCNVENASYGVTLCAECGLVSDLASSGGGRLVAVAIVAGDGRPLAPCGRCRQLLYEHGGPGAPGRRRGERRPHDPRRPAARGLRARRRGVARRPMTPLGRGRHPRQAGRRGAAGRVDPLVPRRLHAMATVADEQASALLMAVFFRGLSPRELATWTDAMIRSGERLDLSPVARPDGRQALHRRRGRQDLAAAVPAGGGLRRRGAPALGPGPRPHRRDPRQARGDPGLAGRT